MYARTRRALARMTLVAMGVALALAFGAMPASAAPTEPVATLAELRSVLETAPGGVLPGYFKSVLRGSAIETFTCEIIAVTGAPGDVIDPDTALVIFQSDDAKIQRIGGIASGMSGSPVFVEIDGVDKLVGAVAYGDSFTLGGMGAATPIEAMEAVEDLGMTEVVAPLSRSVATVAGMKNSVTVSVDALKSVAASSRGSIVLKPLTSLYIGGLDPRSHAYKAYAATAEKRGFTVVPLAAELGTGNESFETTLEGGAGVAVLAARGDLWVGALGTVTYASGDNVMLFGHPMTGEGDTGLYLHNAWVDVTWPNSYFPYKIGVPGKLRGTVTQDRGAGVLGVVGEPPAEVVVRARAHRESASKTATSAVGLADCVANSTSWNWYGITPFAASIAANELFTVWPAPGTAVTATEIDVTDGTDTYTISRTNIFDDDYDIPWASIGDVEFITEEILALHETDPDVRIVDISTEATFTAERNAATITDVTVPDGFKRGDNLVRVAFKQRGVAGTQTVDVTLTVPADAPLDGQLVASGSGESYYYDPEEGVYYYEEEATAVDEERTLAEVVADIRATPTNNVFTVTYGSMEAEKPSAEATAATPWYVSGYASKSARRLYANVYPRSITAGGKVDVEGWIEGATGGTVSIYGITAGTTTETLLATAAITAPKMDDEESSGGDFYLTVGPFYKNTTLKIAYSGDAESLAVQTTRKLVVASRVSLAASRRVLTRGGYVALTANVRPTDFGGSVSFERYVPGYGWRRMALRSAPTGRATYTFKPPAGTVKVRARTTATSTNALGTSPLITLYVR